VDDEDLSDDDDDDEELVGMPAQKKKAGLLSALKKPAAYGAAVPSFTKVNNLRHTTFASNVNKADGKSVTAENVTTTLDLAEESDQPVFQGCTESGTPLSHSPFYWQWEFDDTNNKPHVCICICLPSGICKDAKFRGEIIPTVAADGMSVSVRCVWPPFFTDPLLLQMSLIKEARLSHGTAMCLKMGAVKELKAIRKGLNKGIHQPLSSTTIIPMKHEVETSIKKFRCIADKGCFGRCAVLILKVRETGVGELQNLVQDFGCVDSTRY
jgi:hypothetical protein